MILSKTYSYLHEGKSRTLGNKVTPNGLIKAGVPRKMVEDYVDAEGSLKAISIRFNQNATDAEEQRIEMDTYRQAKHDAEQAIEDFLQEREYLQFAKVDVYQITRLFNSDITDYAIEKATGISRASIGKYRTGKSSVLKMPLQVAIKLSNYAKGNLL